MLALGPRETTGSDAPGGSEELTRWQHLLACAVGGVLGAALAAAILAMIAAAADHV